jgi:bromodomain-containing factor 1
MDLSTMRKKLENHEYANAQRFYDDFKLMIRNCFAFNPAGTPVNQAGIQLQQLFDDRWRALPPLRQVLSDDDEEDEEEDESDDAASRARKCAPSSSCVRVRTDDLPLGAIAAMESQIETMKGSIALLKKPKEKKPKAKKEKIPVASSSRAGGKIAKSSGKKKTKKPIADDDVLTFDQKKDLSEAIGRLDGTKLEKVIQIIHEGVPEIRDVRFLSFTFTSFY